MVLFLYGHGRVGGRQVNYERGVEAKLKVCTGVGDVYGVVRRERVEDKGGAEGGGRDGRRRR